MVLRQIRIALAFIGLIVLVSPPTAQACGHDAFYLGGGYIQQFLVTPEHRLGVGSNDRVRFGIPFTFYGLWGYDFCGSRWGIQMPFEYSRFKLNRTEWVNMMGGSFEGVFHVAAWEDGFDFHLVGGLGLQYLTEGDIQDRTESVGMTASFGPGIAWYFGKGRHLALVSQFPVRAIVFIGDRLSANQTTVIDLPLRLGLTVGF
ncbi:MAG: hypothetical protein HY465_03450 [Deltaproteobacteria bacterium]|nr:hypothetical protein [Deltaproteobacteria bacterium]